MGLRVMRTLLFFDLPSVTGPEKREYRHFVKFLKGEGFIMVQESVYAKLSINQIHVDSTLNSIKKHLPKAGSVAALTVTEKQFAAIHYLMGEFNSDVVESDCKFIQL